MKAGLRYASRARVAKQILDTVEASSAITIAAKVYATLVAMRESNSPPAKVVLLWVHLSCKSLRAQ